MDDRTHQAIDSRALISATPVSGAALRREAALGYWQLLSSPWVLPVILLITVGVFAPTLTGWFQADDFLMLRASQTTPIGQFVVKAFDYRDTPVPGFSWYRPLYFISFRLCYSAFGEHAVAYHALNIALHSGSVVLVWLIARRLLQSIFAANVSSVVFALHPAYTETVEWIARGDTLMVTFVYLITLLAFMNYVGGGKRRRLYYVVSVVGFAAAALYHTTALSLMGILPVYVFLVTGTLSDALKPRWWLRFAPFVVITAVMLVIQTRPEVELQKAFKIGPHQYANLGQYLGLALFPVLPGDWHQLRLLTDIQMAASLAMIGGTLLLLDRREWPYYGVFAASCLYITLAPSTTAVLGVIPPQLYIPGAFLGLYLVLLARRLHAILPNQLLRPAPAIAPFALLALLVAAIVLSLAHERTELRYTYEDRAFIARLRAADLPLTPGSKLYVVDPPLDLIIFNDDKLDAAVELYYGKMDVHHIAAESAERIRATNPAALIVYNRSP